MIRLFVGADGTNSDLESQAVLEWSVRKHASEPVTITWMQQAAMGPWSGWVCASGRTPFSHFRWSVPSVSATSGHIRSIYCDSDFIFMADIAELWRQDIPGVLLLKTPEGKLRTCCMMFDNVKSNGIIPDYLSLKVDSNPQDHMLKYFREHREHMGAFQGDWNCIDGGGYQDLSDARIKAIHYSRIETQLHLKHAIPRLAAEGRKHWYAGEVFSHHRADLQALFDELLAEAIANGYPPERYRVVPFDGSVRKNFTYDHHYDPSPY